MNTLNWPSRAVVCRKDGSYILYNYPGGLSWYLFGPDSRLQYDIAGTLGNGTWGYIVGTYDRDAGTDNQRLYLNGARVAPMSGTLPIDLNSAALGIGRHVSGGADPFNGHIDDFRISHTQRSDGWIQTTWNNMSDPGAFAVAGAEEQEGDGGEPPLPCGCRGGRLPDCAAASVGSRPLSAPTLGSTLGTAARGRGWRGRGVVYGPSPRKWTLISGSYRSLLPGARRSDLRTSLSNLMLSCHSSLG